jgi:hypothetical protein
MNIAVLSAVRADNAGNRPAPGSLWQRDATLVSHYRIYRIFVSFVLPLRHCGVDFILVSDFNRPGALRWPLRAAAPRNENL